MPKATLSTPNNPHFFIIKRCNCTLHNIIKYQYVELWQFFFEIFRKEKQGWMAGKIDIQKEERTVSFNIRPKIQKLINLMKILYYIYYL